MWQCQLVAACVGGSRFQGCHGYLPLGLWLLLPTNLLGISSQAHLFVILVVSIFNNNQQYCITMTRQSSLFFFKLGFLFAACRTRSRWIIKTSNKAVLGHNFQISQVNEWMNELCIYVPHISHIVSRRFTILIEWDRTSACKAPLAAAIGSYFISLTHPTHAWNVQWNYR